MIWQKGRTSCETEISSVIDFYLMCWLLKEPFLTTCCAMSNQHSTRQGVLAPKTVVFNILSLLLEPLPQLKQPSAKRGQYTCYIFPAWLSYPRTSIHQLLLVLWLDLGLQVELELMPQVFNWVKVRTLRGSTPPVDFMLFKEGLCLSGCVLGIIVLHETMVGELFADKRNQRRL